MIRNGTTLRRSLRIVAEITILAGYLGCATSSAHAVPLNDLFDGETTPTITAGDKLFSDWTLIANDFETDLTRIDVAPLASPGNNPGLQFVDTGGVLVAGFPDIAESPEKEVFEEEDLFSNIIDFTFQYTVTILDPRQTIVGASLALTDFVADGAGILNIDETIEETEFFPLTLAGLTTQVQTSLMPIQVVLLDEDSFESQRSLLITTNVFGFVEVPEGSGDSADLVQINSFEQRFAQVPEPVALCLFAAGLVGLGFIARRRRDAM